MCFRVKQFGAGLEIQLSIVIIIRQQRVNWNQTDSRTCKFHPRPLSGHTGRRRCSPCWRLKESYGMQWDGSTPPLRKPALSGSAQWGVSLPYTEGFPPNIWPESLKMEPCFLAPPGTHFPSSTSNSPWGSASLPTRTAPSLYGTFATPNSVCSSSSISIWGLFYKVCLQRESTKSSTATRTSAKPITGGWAGEEGGW